VFCRPGPDCDDHGVGGGKGDGNGPSGGNDEFLPVPGYKQQQKQSENRPFKISNIEHIVSGKFNEQAETEAVQNLKGAICSQIKQKNLQRQACGNSGSGGGSPGGGGSPSGGGQPSHHSGGGGNGDGNGENGGGGGGAEESGGGNGSGAGNLPSPSGDKDSHVLGCAVMPAGYLYDAQGNISGTI
ncbi:hypothetical protein U1Q18_052196, partial [Sarracenia purpurea var. burkii]